MVNKAIKQVLRTQRNKMNGEQRHRDNFQESEE